GLTHPKGQNIETDSFDLAPHGSKNLNLTATATGVGRQTLEARVLYEGRPEAAATADVMIGEQALAIQVPYAVRIPPHQAGELRIVLRNFDPQAARKLVVN